jgi:hypothetical protein
MSGKPVDKVILAGDGLETFDQAVRIIKPGGIVSNINYLGTGDHIKIPRVEWGLAWVISESSAASCPAAERT